MSCLNHYDRPSQIVIGHFKVTLSRWDATPSTTHLQSCEPVIFASGKVLRTTAPYPHAASYPRAAFVQQR